MSSEPAKAISAPPTYRNPPLGTVIEANVCKSTQLVMQGEEEGCRYSMGCIYGELACATAIEAKPIHLQAAPSWRMNNYDREKTILGKRPDWFSSKDIKLGDSG